MNKLFFLVGLLLLSSCSDIDKEEKVVQVYDEFLTKPELELLIDDNLSAKDSSIQAENIIENWVKNKMLLAQAERNLPDSLKEFTKKLEEEKNNLLIYTYEKEFISQKLDTVVNYNELLKFYSEHEKSFNLRDYILQYSYVQVSEGNDNISKQRVNILLQNLPESESQLIEYCTEMGGAFSSDTSWTYFEEFVKTIPIEVYNIQNFLKKQKFIELQSDNFRYFVFIHDFELKDSTAPLEVVKEKVKNLILNQRKQQMLKELRKNLYSAAVKENHIIYFK